MSPFDPVRRRIEIQGFTGLSDEKMREADPWIRFTPFITALIASAGALTASIPLLLFIGAMAGLGAASRRHPFDWFYDRAIRPLEDSPELPANTPRRRVVFGVTAAWALAAAWCFSAGHSGWGYTLGLTLGATRGVVAGLQICVISEMLEWGKGMFGERRRG